MMHSLRVPESSTLPRLDVFLTRALPSCSRRQAREMIAAGAVRVNGRRVRKGVPVAGGDRVDVEDAWLAPPALRPSPELEVPVLYEDAALLALDKPAGVPSHALRGDETRTIANFLLARYPEIATVGRHPLEPGIVHRLDIDTSGVLLVARTPSAWDALRRQFAEHRVRKEYRAIVHGDLAHAADIRTPLTAARTRVRVQLSDTAAGGRPAWTQVRPLERFGACTLVAIEITTGVRHQIRVHLASAGHPVVADRRYGPLESAADPLRQLLHACRLGFTHPDSAEYVEVSSPVPPDFTAYLDRLRSGGSTQSSQPVAGAPRRQPRRRTHT